ncbi:FHA domain-containing protein [Mycobacterium sp. URHB0044]|uniref:FHA domain-containing protein n=1 Tax=Mycobacterium sp. URHB0044 TaxID=1380386 RepID=UPI000490DDD0|nr:FHA domain-containing protein [Mycobacterium sp. URHB0044]
MYRLEFRYANGRSASFDEQRTLRIGRSHDNDIILDSPSVSRRHAELRPTATGWDLHDIGSAGGTWINDQRVSRVSLGVATTVRFGAVRDGVAAYITVDLPRVSADGPPDLGRTVLLSDQQHTYIYGDGQSSTGPGIDELLIRTRDGDKRFGADTPVRIGRDARSDVVVDEAAVSRQHANVGRRSDGWWFVDHSNSGSFIDGERVKEKKITEQTVVQLGHPDAGYQLVLVPVADVASAQRAIVGKRRRRTATRWAAAGAVVAVVAGGVATTVLLTGGSAHENALSTANLERAKRASVQIVALDADGIPEWTGSGTVIDSAGLILTNAHVAKPTAKGLAGGDIPDHDPSVLQVAFAKDDNTPAVTKYRATPLVSDGYLDLSVIKIDANADGTPLSAGKPTLPEPVPIGNSDALQTGDHITALGYPALTGDQHVGGPRTVTSGDVSAFKRDYGTNTERFWIDTTERIAHGNSGGASINTAGELIAVNTRFRKGQENEPAASYLVRPIALAADVIKIARDGGDPTYVSPYLAKIQHLPDEVSAKSAGWSMVGTEKGDPSECGPTRNEDNLNQLTGVQSGDVVYAKFSVTGIPDDTPFAVGFFDPTTNDIIDSLDSVWIYGKSSRCISPAFQIPAGISQVVAVIDIGYQDDLQVTNAVDFS